MKQYRSDVERQKWLYSMQQSRADIRRRQGKPHGNSRVAEGLKAINDQSKEVLEAYAYDKAGNMQEKIINGEKTAMTYNAANQLATVTNGGAQALAPSLPGGTRALASVAETAQNLLTYTYDKAGRMTGPSGGAMSTYGWLDKVTTITQPDGTQVAFEYWPDGQLAAKRILTTENTESTETEIQKISNPPATPSPINAQPSTSETYLWDGLALLRRGNTIYINEPHPSGGSVIASFPKDNPSDITYYLNDLLGTTLATVNGSTKQFAKLTAFGQPLKQAAATASPTDLIAGDLPANPVPETDSLLQTTP